MEKEIKVTPLYFDYVYGAKYDAVIEVGGRYSGKSYNSEIEEVGNLASKEDYKLLIIQDLDKGGSDGYYAGLVDKIEQFEHTPAYNITTSSTKIVNNINGNTVLFRGYKTPQQKKDVKNIDQVTKIVVEEGEWMTFDDFLALIQQLRGKVEADRRLDVLLNPVNSECFVNKDIIQDMSNTKVLMFFPGTNRPKVFEKKMVVNTVNLDGKETTLSINILVVLSTHYDNPYLTGIQRASIEIYKDTDPDKYAQLGEARFIQSSGAYFKEFDESVHVIEPFNVPNDWYWYTTMDYGLDMQATYKIAIDYQGDAYVVAEVYRPNQIISEAAKNNIELLGHHFSQANYGPPDLMKRQQTDGKTTWELFNENGWSLTKSDNNREIGSLATKEWLKVYDRLMEDGTIKKDARLKIFNTCPNLIRTIKQVLTHKNNPNVYATKSSEVDGTCPANYHELTHGPDGIRYFCIMHNVVPIQTSAKRTTADIFFNRNQDEDEDYFCGTLEYEEGF